MSIDLQKLKDPLAIANPEVSKEYEAIEEILRRQRYDTQEVKEHILKIGYKLESTFKETGSEFLISDISNIILKTLKRRGLGHLRSSVYRFFDDFPHWKREQSSSTGVSPETDLPEEFYITLEQVDRAYKVINKEFDTQKITELNLSEETENKVKRQIENLRGLHDDVTDKFQNLYKEKKWTSLDQNYDVLTEGEKLQKSERSHIKKPPRIADEENPALQGLIYFDNILHKMMDKLREYPMTDRDKSVRIGEGWKTFAHWFRPNVDNKWRADSFMWIKIVLGLKHVSIQKMSNMTRTPDIYGELRRITKEQISDNKYRILKFNYQLMKKIPGVFELSEWFQEASLPYRKELTNATSGKLSDVA